MSYRFSEGVYGGGLYEAIGQPSETKITTWSFSIDGHPFAFIKVGDQGTLIYDMSTGQWSSWNIEGSIGLGFDDGESFAEFYLMGSEEDGKIYTFDFNQLDDEAGGFTTILTGGVTTRMREAQPCFSVYAAGNRSTADDRSISLLTSDDGGYSWRSHGSLNVSEVNGEASWRSLGVIKSPGRMFEIQDTGVFSSIDSLDMPGN